MLPLSKVDMAAEKDSAKQFQMVRKTPKLLKPKLIPPTAFERVFGKTQKAKDHYFTAGVKINESNQRNVHAEILPFKYPADLEEFSFKVMSRAWRGARKRKESSYKISERPSHRMRQKVDLLNRLYVKEPELKGIKLAKDLDPDFFQMIDGRPVIEKFNRWDYIKDVRENLRLKIINGYREDDVLLLEENYAIEQKAIDQIRTEFQRYVNTFEEFLFTDHTQSMKILRIGEEESLVAKNKYDILKKLSMDFGSLKSAVYALEERWRNCKLYQKFLYLLSPMEWREVHDFFYITNKESGEQPESEDAIFGRFKLSSGGDSLTLDNLIDQFLFDVEMQYNPELYFKNPQQLMKVFRFIEIQNLNTLLRSEELAILLEQFKTVSIKSETHFNDEIASLQDNIDSLEGDIIFLMPRWEEARAKFLEELALELISGAFKEIVCNDDAVNLHVFVEDVYENRIALNDSKLPMIKMMKVIELVYREYLLILDRLPDIIVHNAEMACYKEESRTMKTAYEASRKVIEVERLMYRLSRLLQPPMYTTLRSLKWRSTPLELKAKPPIPPPALTQEEIDYFTFFADDCNETPIIITSSDDNESH